MNVALIFCDNLDEDPVALHVYRAVLGLLSVERTDIELDGMRVLRARRGSATTYIVRTETVLSHDYSRYSKFLNESLRDVSQVIIVNWHQGANAPDRIFCIQATGDMESGCFSPVHPAVIRKLYFSIEQCRTEAGLDDYTTWLEATHWSGKLYQGQPGSTLLSINASVLDVEIGSSPTAWANPTAANVLGRALVRATDFTPRRESLIPILCVGGSHFEPSFTEFMQRYGQTEGYSVSHILPNQWLVSYKYDEPRHLNSLHAAAQSTVGGLAGIVYHDKLKASFKEQARQLGELLKVPAMSHRKFRNLASSDRLHDIFAARHDSD
ncbi:D-aminoacyl-tRNA deacylase [Ochrobactrum sp. XJ1]|nr:D-aminoacyl-tRNA deacylase [Ochrobactrum sp. XJ1]